MGYPDEIIIDIVKELRADRLSSILTLLYTSQEHSFFCRWNFNTNKKQDHTTITTTNDALFESAAEGTLMVQGLDPDRPSNTWQDGNYVEMIERTGRNVALRNPFKKKDQEYIFSHPHHSLAEKSILHHVILPEYCYYILGSINKNNVSIWKADTRVCITWLNVFDQTTERKYTLSFAFAGPNKEKFQTMKEERETEVKTGLKPIRISEDNKTTILTIAGLAASALELSNKFIK